MSSFHRSCRRSASSRRNWPVLACESLESRTLLTGNVTAQLAGSTLKITGDGGSHQIRIVGSAEGELTLIGVSNTSINTVNNGSENFSKVKNISIDFGNGNCTLTFITTDITGKLNVKGGGGSNKVNFGENNNGHNSFGKFFAQLGVGNNEINVNDARFSVPGTVKIVGGNGSNRTDLDPTVSLELGKVTIIGGVGSDFIDLGDTLVTTKSLNVQMGDGDNDFYLDGNVTVNGKITVTGGEGSDDFQPGDGGGTGLTVTKAIKLDLGNGTNVVHIAQTNANFQGALSFTGGSGKDTFKIDSADSVFNGAVSLRTGGGNDEVVLSNVQFNAPLTIDSGDGADLVKLEGFSDGWASQFAAPVKINLGNDNDEIKIGLDADDFIQVLASFTVDGGAGTNTLTDSGTNFFDSPPNLSGF